MALAERVLDTIRRLALMRRGDRVLVALSGGPDSVALTRLLGELEGAGELSIAGIAHLNHGLREAAGEDEEFCRAMAAQRALPFRSDLVDVRALAARLGTSLEDAGRRARYELFERVATELGADVIATGHTRDDQAETFLLRLLRGAGPRGLGGIHPKTRLPAEAPEARRWSLPAEAPEARRCVVRPLLEIGRDELRAYLASVGQVFRDDESNRDLSIPRNRVRHELLPLVSRDFSPGITDVLAREATIARQDEDRLQQEAIDLLDLIVLRNETGISGEAAVELDARALSALHPALAVRVARIAMETVAPGRFVGFDHVERLLALARDAHAEGALSLPGQHAVRRGETLVLDSRRADAQPFSNSFRVSLSIPGEVVLAPQGWAISATRCVRTGADHGGDTQPGQSPGTLKVECPRLEQTVAADGLALPLAVRSRKPGDWLSPLGMGGRRKKVQDVLVDRKVPREGRDSLPLVVDSADRIVWVVGESVAEDFRVTEASQAVILLKARRLGGQG
jgi:tRNA(Ile)-lysidine synthase